MRVSSSQRRPVASPSLHESSICPWLDRVRGEYLEMPGLSLTERQAQRLWNVDPEMCRALLEALTQAGFLYRTAGGAYVRAKSG